jgi:hypothetical protein
MAKRRSRRRRRSESRQKEICVSEGRGSRCILAQERKQERESKKGDGRELKEKLKADSKRHVRPHHRRIKKKKMMKKEELQKTKSRLP